MSQPASSLLPKVFEHQKISGCTKASRQSTDHLSLYHFPSARLNKPVLRTENLASGSLPGSGLPTVIPTVCESLHVTPNNCSHTHSWYVKLTFIKWHVLVSMAIGEKRELKAGDWMWKENPRLPWHYPTLYRTMDLFSICLGTEVKRYF